MQTGKCSCGENHEMLISKLMGQICVEKLATQLSAAGYHSKIQHPASGEKECEACARPNDHELIISKDPVDGARLVHCIYAELDIQMKITSVTMQLPT